jgi:glycerol-3-phosphate dehydrogenase
MQRDLKKLADTEYDVLIVGAGIYGSSAAWDGTSRGLRVALIDKEDFASGNSSNSLKIIHGGLRYLQSLNIKRMRESISERTTLMRIAPHLIHPMPCVMPTYGHGMKSATAMNVALLLNDIIGYDRNEIDDPQKHLPRGRIVSKNEVEMYLPGYMNRDMTGGALWFDCRCYNTERLVLSYVLSAAEQGADVANYVECVALLLKDDTVIGAKVRDALTGEAFEIKARIVLNASGPWIDSVLGSVGSPYSRKGILPSVAMNIVVKRDLLNGYAAGLRGAYQDSRNGTSCRREQIYFFVPWRGYTLIGTNHIPYENGRRHRHVREQEIRQFVQAVNAAYPGADIKHEEISFYHSGIIPATRVRARSGEVKLLSHYYIHDHWVEEKIEGLISIVGVKYTTHRDVVSKAINMVFGKLGKKSPSCKTDKTPILGGDIRYFEDFLSDVLMNDRKFDKAIIRHLVYTYGSQYENILGYGNETPDLLERTSGSREVLKAEIVHGVREEMAVRLSDIILRRTDLGTAEKPRDETLSEVANIMAAELGWDEHRIKGEVEQVRELYRIAA